MAAQIGFKVEGLAQLTRQLQDVGLDIDDLKRAFASVANEGARVAAGFAPRRSGNLRASIRGNRAKSKAVVAAGRAAVPYAGAINYGWPKRGIGPRLFMQKTDEVMRPRAIKRLEDEINVRIKLRGLA